MWLYIYFFINIIVITQAQFDFDPPCTCEGSRCDCCLNAFFIDQEGCIRVTLKNNRIRISFILNENELGGFSTRLGTLPLPAGFRFTVPCLPNTNLSLRLRNSSTKNGNQRFCINLFARGPRRVLYDQDFCFDVNGNNLATATIG